MITSLANKLIKDTAVLKKAGERKNRGLFLIDGQREIEMALRGNFEIVSLFYCPELIGSDPVIPGAIEPEKMVEVSRVVFSKICYKDNPDGFLAVAKAKYKELKDLPVKNEFLLIILENVEKPGNLGGIIRTAYAAGAEAVIVNSGQTDIYNPNVIRASEGYVFEKNIIVASVEDTQRWLKENKVKSFGAATVGTKSYTTANFNGRAAIVLGSEAEGLSEKWLAGADQLIKIPMEAGIDSLNVSVSAAIIVYEALRQREGK